MNANINTTNMLIRCGILICATTIPSDEKLDSYTYEYLESKDIKVKPYWVTESVDKYHIGAKLYGNYRDNLSRVQKIGLIQELYRFLWLYNFVAVNYESITPVNLLTILNNKYEEEKMYNEYLDRNKFFGFKIIDKEFCTNEMLKSNGKALSKFTRDLAKAHGIMSKSFAELEGFEYMIDIYSSMTEGLSSAQNPALLVKPMQAQIEDKAQSNEIDLSKSNQASKTELQLRDEIRILRSDKHDLEVKLSYAKKDAIREFISALTGYGWSCPLSELYRLLNDEETPEKIKGIINNLFMALSDENVKVSKGRVGSTIILSEENQKMYDPYKNEQLFLGEKAEIYYPGFRYDHEIMIRPIVRKIKDEENNPNENG